MQSFSSQNFVLLKRHRFFCCVFFFAVVAGITGCNHTSGSSQGNSAWVSAPEAVLRDRVATV